MGKKIVKLVLSIVIVLLIAVSIILNDIFFEHNLNVEGYNFIKYLLLKDFIYIFVTLLAFFTSIVVLGVSVYYLTLKQKHKLLIGYSILSLVMSVWCLVQIDFIMYLFKDLNFVYYIKNYALYLIPLCITLVSYEFIKKSKVKMIYLVVTIVFSLLLLTNVIVHLINKEVLQILYYSGFVLIVLYLLSLLVLVYKLDEEKTKYRMMFIKTLIICAVGFTLEFINLFVNVMGPTGMYLTLCLIVLFCLTISHVVGEYVNKENSRTFLSEENARLSSSILLSQIKPHFLYNALNSISYLCKKDPKQADMAVIRFSRYLRQNMKCIESSELVDFGSEMEHIKNYLYLESIRFPKMEIIYELKYINFKVPPLCIQPIVENSVKHGVSKNTEGGYVIIKSYASAKHIVIEISDNGPGFDTSVNMKGTGLSNISRRLKMLISAEIEFGSVVGKGTVVRVKIPREDVK